MFTQNIFSFHNAGVVAFFLVVAIGALILLPFLWELLHNRTVASIEAKRLANRSVWVWKALKQYSKTNPPPNGTNLLSAEDRIRKFATELIELADEHGFVVNIHNEPDRPLAMGSYTMEYAVYPRSRRETSA